MKIYVIQKGQYSDRHVIGITDNKKKAERICDMLDAGYSEWGTDQFNVDNCIRFEVYDPNCSYNGEWTADYDEYDIYDNYQESVEINNGVYIIYANSPSQAIKIAQDMKAEKLAKKTELL